MHKYEILDKIGEGNFGSIYKCRNRHNGRMNAVKIDRGDGATLKRETQILLYLGKNDYTVPIKWYGVFNEVQCLVMQLMGRSLNEVHTELTEDNKERLTDAVEFLHSKNVLHRDIKPSNFIYNLEMTKIYIIDFGMAISADSPQGERKSPLGTPNFMSIKMHNSPKAPYSAEDDMESLGYVFLFLKGGRRLPWDGCKTNDEILKMKIRFEET